MPNVAWKNPDGSKALIAYNTTGSSQSVKVNWGGAVLHLHAAGQDVGHLHLDRHAGRRRSAAAPDHRLAGKCVDVAGASSANGTAVQLYDCNGTAAQQWTGRSTARSGRWASAWT